MSEVEGPEERPFNACRLDRRLQFRDLTFQTIRISRAPPVGAVRSDGVEVLADRLAVDGIVMYVALLRGVNVAGKPKVEMRRLKATFERLGLDDVRTYINSGNVLFTTKQRGRPQLTKEIEAGIADDFGVEVDVLLRTADELRVLVDAIPASWTNDAAMKCDVYFLWPAVDHATVLDDMPHNPAIEDLRHSPARSCGGSIATSSRRVP